MINWCLEAAGQAAEARIARVTAVLALIQGDPEGRALLAKLWLCEASVGRSSRIGRGGASEGLAVLESVVLIGVASRLLSDPPLVRWLSDRHPAALARLHAVTRQMPMSA